MCEWYACKWRRKDAEYPFVEESSANQGEAVLRYAVASDAVGAKK
jgi:hypothetical protein